MKKIISLTAVLSALLLTSCMSMIVKNTIRDTPIGNKIILHDNAKTGDYAVYRAGLSDEDPQAQAMMGETTVNVQIVSAKGNDVHIRHATNSTGMSGMFVNNIVFEIFSDKEGNVKRGTYNDGKETIELKIAGPGDENYNEFLPLKKADRDAWNIPERITVPAGTFDVEAMYYNDKQNTDDIQAVYLGSKKAKFYHVATILVNKKEGNRLSTVLELVEQGNR